MKNNDIRNTSLYNKCKDCMLLIEVRKHPWNQKIGKGKMGDCLGWGCTPFSDDGIVIFIENEDSLGCEMFTKKPQT